jgi:hypothetical protein
MMTPPPTDHETLNTGIAWFELVSGCLYLVLGIRGGLRTRYFRPLGLWFILAAASRFLAGRISDGALITLAVLGFLAVAVWFLRVRRAVKAHTREVIRQRAQAKF